MSRGTHVSAQSQLSVTYGTLTPFGRPFQQRSARDLVSYSVVGLPPHLANRPTPSGHRRQPVPPVGFGLLPFRSPLLRESSLVLGVLRCFSSPTYLHSPYVFRGGSPSITLVGLPHSDTLGSALARSSPRRFVAWPRPSSAPDTEASTVRSSCGMSIHLHANAVSTSSLAQTPSTARVMNTPTALRTPFVDASTSLWWSFFLTQMLRMVLPCARLLKCKRWS